MATPVGVHNDVVADGDTIVAYAMPLPFPPTEPNTFLAE